MSISGLSSSSLRSFEGSRTGSLHPIDSLSDIDVTSKSMSIRDYYHASSTSEEKQITYQHGMSNYSSLVLGDERIAFTKSMTQCMHDIERDNLDVPNSPSDKGKRYKSENARRKEYMEAIDACGGKVGVDGLEEIIRVKLAQRNKFGPFQLARNLKYYDRNNTGYVDEYDFARSLGLMGFQFQDHQSLALFARFLINFVCGY